MVKCPGWQSFESTARRLSMAPHVSRKPHNLACHAAFRQNQKGAPTCIPSRKQECMTTALNGYPRDFRCLRPLPCFWLREETLRTFRTVRIPTCLIG